MENPFEIILTRLDSIEKQLKEINKSGNLTETSFPATVEILNLVQASEYLSVTKSTLYKYTSGREVPHFKRGKKLYFKKSEIDEWVTKNRVKTKEEIEKEADEYLARKGKFRRH